MLYILPPLKSQNWNNLMCANNGSSNEQQSWGKDNKKPPRIRLRNLQIIHKKKDDSSPFKDDVDSNRNSKSLSECYFAGKGTALVLPDAEARPDVTGGGSGRQGSGGAQGGPNSNSSIQRHLQSMFYLLRPEETLKMAVKLESVHPGRTRYLVVVSRMGTRGEESCLLGIDCNEKTTVGLVLKVLANTKITLDGDGGFSVSVCERHHIFKPVSVQAMWSALQTLHRVSAKARQENYFAGGGTHGWVDNYENRIESDRSCLNEWHAMDNLESRRPPSPDSVRTKPTEREETEKVIRTTLKEIMMTVDLDEITSKAIRTRLEDELDMDLGEYKSFIDQEMLVILGQMDAPTEIFDHVYLGSEWNASNYEELQKNGVGHILNVTREIDNFFPGTFDYLNVRVYDDEKTDLLRYWDDTFKYITKAKNKGSKVLVHCKMGVSRSASVVIAYAMKAYNWDFERALRHVKNKRSCIKPNLSFLSQLETYQGILDAMKNKEKLQRSKSETNLKSPCGDKIPPSAEPTPLLQALNATPSGRDLREAGCRPKSWSPDNLTTRELSSAASFMSLDDISGGNVGGALARHVLMPCDNGESYSVSPNQIVHLPGHDAGVTNHRSEEKKVVRSLASKFESETIDERPRKDTWDPGEGAPRDLVLLPTAICDNNCDNGESSPHRGPKGDPFSNQLDRVFDKEEKKQRDESRECPSRQSSWSSYDSAVVLGYPETVELSRHSSWGSGDTTRTLPSRNSSWGSYDMRPRKSVFYNNEKGEKVLHDPFESSSGIFPYDREDIPWHPGTVRRTRQRLECGEAPKRTASVETIEAVNECLFERAKTTTEMDDDVSSPPIDIPEQDNNKRGAGLVASGLSVSAPEEGNFEGKVKNLKREFEAKVESGTTSAPSSPPEQGSKCLTGDDLDLKSLIGMFEGHGEESGVKLRCRTGPRQPFRSRHSCIQVSSKTQSRSAAVRLFQPSTVRPPATPATVRHSSPGLIAATVIATAAKKQLQYGKSHPLARLNVRPRHNNPVYNTM